MINKDYKKLYAQEKLKVKIIKEQLKLVLKFINKEIGAKND